MKRLLLLFALCFVFVGCERMQPIDPTPPVQPGTPANKQLLLDLHNQQRGNGNELQADYGLMQFAQEHAEWMASRQRLKHSDLGVSGWNRVGENIAYGQRSESQVVEAWMNSRGHRANIMNERFTHVGFGYAVDKNGTPYWCSVFGG